jgi:hypothetical protein
MYLELVLSRQKTTHVDPTVGPGSSLSLEQAFKQSAGIRRLHLVRGIQTEECRPSASHGLAVVSEHANRNHDPRLELDLQFS